MIDQGGAEVIVVDYGCPDKSGDVVEREFPSVRVVRVDGEQGFSNWKGRNRGAAQATGDMLLFCDADTVLAAGALDTISKALPERTFGFFTRNSSAHFNKSGLRLGKNQLRGFQVVPADAFRKLEGYDEVPVGYAAGGDTDLEERLGLMGIKGRPLGDGIVDEVFEHDNQARLTFHREPITVSYGAGLLYRRAKIALLKSYRATNLPLEHRQLMYTIARQAAMTLTHGENIATMQINLENQPIGMPRQLGFEEGKCTVSINVRLALRGKIDQIPQ